MTTEASAKTLSADGEPNANAKFQERWQRVMDCVKLKQPDRMPSALFFTFWLAKYGNVSCRDVLYDTQRLIDLTIQVTRDLDPDLCCPPTDLGFGRLLDATQYRQLQWPGHGVPETQGFQYLDREYMTAEEYDEFLFDPTGFYYGKYLPRVAGTYDGCQGLAAVAGSTYYEINFDSVVFADPNLQRAINGLAAAGSEAMKYFGCLDVTLKRLAALGYPAGFGGGCFGPYDNLADYYRGATNMMKDLFRRPDKVLAALDKMKNLTLRRLAMQKPAMPNPIVFIPVHWAADSFMSPKQFNKFWWPSFRELLIGIIDLGLIPMPMWEHDCTSRLETIADIPPGRCIYWFERTDMVKAFQVLGDVVALRGGMHTSIMTIGTPDDVDSAVKHLVDNVWRKGGNLILDTAFGIPDETPIENVRAMYRAARRYG